MQVKDGIEKVTTNSWLKATAMWKHYLAVPARKWYRENLHVYFYQHQPVFNCIIFHQITKLGCWPLLRLNDSDCKETSKPGLSTLWPEKLYLLVIFLFGMSLTVYQLQLSLHHLQYVTVCHLEHVTMHQLQYVIVCQFQYVTVCHLQHVTVSP